MKNIIEAIEYLADVIDAHELYLHDAEKDNYYSNKIKSILEKPELTRKECGCNKDEACFECSPELIMEDFEEQAQEWEEERQKILEEVKALLNKLKGSEFGTMNSAKKNLIISKINKLLK